MLQVLTVFLMAILISTQSKAQALFENPDSAVGLNYELQIHAPFTQLFKKRDKELDFDATLGIRKLGQNKPWQVVPVKISVRGTTSLPKKECPFPKLKLKIINADKSELLKEQSSVKIATHCGDIPTPSHAGRVRNKGAGVGAEYLTYKLMHTFGMPAQKVEFVQITYIDSDSQIAEITRPAFLLENEETTANRLHSKVLKYNEGMETSGADFSNVIEEKVNFLSAAMVYLMEALTGNNDFSLPLTGIVEDPDNMQVGIKNAVLLENSKERFAIAQDFDLSAIVTGLFPPLSSNNCGLEPPSEAEKIRTFVDSRVQDLRHQMLETDPLLTNAFYQAVTQMNAQLPRAIDTVLQAETLHLIDASQSRRFKTFLNEFRNSLKRENLDRPFVPADQDCISKPL